MLRLDKVSSPAFAQRVSHDVDQHLDCLHLYLLRAASSSRSSGHDSVLATSNNTASLLLPSPRVLVQGTAACSIAGSCSSTANPYEQHAHVLIPFLICFCSVSWSLLCQTYNA